MSVFVPVCFATWSHSNHVTYMLYWLKAHLSPHVYIALHLPIALQYEYKRELAASAYWDIELVQTTRTYPDNSRGICQDPFVCGIDPGTYKYSITARGPLAPWRWSYKGGGRRGVEGGRGGDGRGGED